MLTPSSLPAVIALVPSSAVIATTPAPSPRAREVRPRRPGRRASCTSALIRVLVREDTKERDQDDLEVEGQAPVLDVVQVVDQALLDRRMAAQVVDLRPPGQARPNPVPIAVAVVRALELAHEDRALRARADQA